MRSATSSVRDYLRGMKATTLARRCFARRAVMLLAACAPLAACGGTTPTSPSSTPAPSEAPPPAGSPQTSIRIVDAITGAGVAGVTATINSQRMVPSDSSGQFVAWASLTGQYTITFSGAPIVPRSTSIKVPASETSVSTIPTSFDLASFNEMFRTPQKLQRWTSAPPLVILTRPVVYENSYYSNTLTVGDGEISADDQQALLRDLSDGFLALTDHQLGGFPGQRFEDPGPAGTPVNVMRTGVILVARCKGLTDNSPDHFWGYGRWATNPTGAVVGGNVMLDADFDGPAGRYPQYHRTLRIHELGHALGYNHVTLRASVMNSTARLEPNAWDLQAVHIAFQRPPGNTAPDNDPSFFSLNARTGTVTWGPPIF